MSSESDDLLENEPDQGQYYVGVVFEKDGAWYIDGCVRADGPFATKELAEDHKVRLTEALKRREQKRHNEALARWDARNKS